MKNIFIPGFFGHDLYWSIGTPDLKQTIGNIQFCDEILNQKISSAQKKFFMKCIGQKCILCITFKLQYFRYLQKYHKLINTFTISEKNFLNWFPISIHIFRLKLYNYTTLYVIKRFKANISLFYDWEKKCFLISSVIVTLTWQFKLFTSVFLHIHVY